LTYASSRRFTVSGARSRSRTTCAGAHATPTLVPQSRFSQGRHCLSASQAARHLRGRTRAESHPPGGGRQRTPGRRATRGTRSVTGAACAHGASVEAAGAPVRPASLGPTAPGSRSSPCMRRSRAPLSTATRLPARTSSQSGLGARGREGAGPRLLAEGRQAARQLVGGELGQQRARQQRLRPARRLF